MYHQKKDNSKVDLSSYRAGLASAGAIVKYASRTVPGASVAIDMAFNMPNRTLSTAENYANGDTLDKALARTAVREGLSLAIGRVIPGAKIALECMPVVERGTGHMAKEHDKMLDEMARQGCPDDLIETLEEGGHPWKFAHGLAWGINKGMDAAVNAIVDGGCKIKSPQFSSHESSTSGRSQYMPREVIPGIGLSRPSLFSQSARTRTEFEFKSLHLGDQAYQSAAYPSASLGRSSHSLFRQKLGEIRARASPETELNCMSLGYGS